MIALGAAGAVLVLSNSFASSDGAEEGYSGGPAGFGWSCASCHPLSGGDGSAELFGVPRRYRPGELYDLTIRISDSDPEKAGAGFEISAEGITGHEGLFHITDGVGTQFAASGGQSPYVTHSAAGLAESLSVWDANGGSYEYNVRWEAPTEDVGPVTFFAAGNAVNDGMAFYGDQYYGTYAISGYAVPGDGDGDTDVDLYDFALFQQCFSGTDPIESEQCTYLNFDGDGTVSLSDARAFIDLLTGPTATLPAGYVLADHVRGGLLYDKWWKINGAEPPSGDHPLYPPEGQQGGSSTYRCKECHGWDYKGVDGAYGSGSHYTGIVGVFQTGLAPRELFDLLEADPAVSPNGHDMDAYGMTDADLWDVVKMTLEGVVDTENHVDPEGAFIGDPTSGENRYNSFCAACHDWDGRLINFGDEINPVYVGTIANDNPWEFLHKVRHGHPASPMMGFELLHWDAQSAADVGVHAATLPTE